LTNAGTLVLHNDLVFDAGGGFGESTGGIEGTGGLIIASGVLNLFDLNSVASYSGATEIRAGTGLRLHGTSTLSASARVINNGLLDFTNATGTGIPTGHVVKSLSGVGELWLGANPLVIGSGAGENFGGVISGSGGLILQQGSQSLSGVNTYTGVTNIQGTATLRLDGTGSIRESSRVDVTGTLDIATNGSASIRALGGNGDIGIKSSSTLSLTDGSGIFSGVISGAGGVAVNGGSHRFRGNNTYTGTTKLNGGILQVEAEANLGSGGLTFDGGTLRAISSMTINRNIVVDTGGGALDAFGPLNEHTLNGTISGAGTLSLTTTQPGISIGTPDNYLGNRFRLAPNNTYSGGTTISNEAVAVFTGTNSFGTGTITMAASGGQLEAWADGMLLPNAITLNASATGDDPNIIRLGTNNFSTHLSGLISGPGGMRISGSGTLLLTDNNSYTGETVIGPNVNLLLSGGAGIAGSSNVQVHGGLDLSRLADDTSLVSISGAGTVDLGGNSLTLSDPGGGFAGVISGSGGLIKAGPGTFTLSGVNTYSGGTTVRSGTLAVNGGEISHAGADLFVGQQAGEVGTLTITGGGTVNNKIGFIGRSANSEGTVTVTGAGSSWTSSSVVVVGDAGAGVLTISGGGAVANTDARIGDENGSAGTVTVTGDGSTWNNSGVLKIGQKGAGMLTIANGGNVTSTSAAIGTDAAGTVTVTGAGSVWANTGGLDIATFSSGTLTIAAGGVVSTADARMGIITGTTGTLNIGAGGAAGVLDAAGIDGGAGAASLNFNHADAAYHFTRDGTAGGAAVDITGSTAVNHLGAGTTILTGNNTYSGGTRIEAGVLQIGNGGTAGSIAGDVINNAALVFNRSDALSFDNVISGTGSLHKRGAGTLTLTGANTCGGGTTVNLGTLVVEGGTIDHARATVSVGDQAGDRGILIITDGGKVSNGVGRAGRLAGSTGEVAVTGFGSTWTSNVVIVGDAGIGMLTIADGGIVVSNRDGRIGDETGSTGTVTVTGSGSDWTNGTDLLIGRLGNGTLTIEDGATASNRNSFIGFDTDSAGTVMVTGNESAWTHERNLVVGRSGTGTLTIADLGTVSNSNAIIGAFAESNGTLTVTGAGSTWTNSGDLDIGVAGSGNLTIAAGAHVEVGGDLTLGQNTGSSGTIHIGAGSAAGVLDAAGVDGRDGAAVLNFNHTDTDYHFTDDGTKDGTAIVISGSTAVNHTGTGTTVLAGANTYTGATTVAAGTLRMDGALADTATTVAGGAALAGTGIIAGAVTVADSGTLAPGASAGTLATGALALAGASILDYELAAPGTTGAGINDRIEVDGDLVLDGILHVTDLGGFAPGTYTLITYTGTLTDNGLNLAPLPGGLPGMIDTQTAGEVRLVVEALVAELTLDPAAVDFGNVEVGTTGDPQRVTLTNTGNTDLAVGALALGGANAGDFALADDTCSNHSVPADAICTFDIVLRPSAPGTLAGQVEIPSNAQTSPDTVALAGAGIQARVALDPSALDFGVVLPGSTRTETIEVSNTGEADLNLSEMTDPSAPFAILGGTCTAVPVTLGPGERCDIVVEFAPVMPGQFNAAFDLASNAPSSPDTVSLAGSAQVIAVPALNRFGLALLVLALGALARRYRDQRQGMNAGY